MIKCCGLSTNRAFEIGCQGLRWRCATVEVAAICNFPCSKPVSGHCQCFSRPRSTIQQQPFYMTKTSTRITQYSYLNASCLMHIWLLAYHYFARDLLAASICLLHSLTHPKTLRLETGEVPDDEDYTGSLVLVWKRCNPQGISIHWRRKEKMEQASDKISRKPQ